MPLLTTAEVLKALRMSRSKFDRLREKEGFPEPVKRKGKGGTNLWNLDEIKSFLGDSSLFAVARATPHILVEAAVITANSEVCFGKSPKFVAAFMWQVAVQRMMDEFHKHEPNISQDSFPVPVEIIQLAYDGKFRQK